MANENAKRCKSKGCSRPVLTGNYCEYCKRKRKETMNKVLKGAGGVGIPVVGVAIKKGALKQVPKVAVKVLQVVLRK